MKQEKTNKLHDFSRGNDSHQSSILFVFFLGQYNKIKKEEKRRYEINASLFFTENRIFKRRESNFVDRFKADFEAKT